MMIWGLDAKILCHWSRSIPWEMSIC